MAAKKKAQGPKSQWASPCGLCKGKSKTPCVVCGHKVEALDIYRAEGRRQRVDFLTRLLARRTMEVGGYYPDVDVQIELHRAWLTTVYLRIRVGREKLATIAKEEDLTVGVLGLAVNMYANWLRRHSKLGEIRDLLTKLHVENFNGKTVKYLANKYDVPLTVAQGAMDPKVFYAL